MKTNEFTPGPWQVWKDLGAVGAHFRPDMPDGGYYAEIAVVDTGVKGGEANLYLIASAPDLLAACEDARETLDSFLIGKIPPEHRVAELERVLQLMNQAAAKATGA